MFGYLFSALYIKKIALAFFYYVCYDDVNSDLTVKKINAYTPL